MSIFSSLYIGMSGMRVNETGFAVVGDNIANMNTVGFKASRALFADVLNRTIIGSAGISDLGQGAVVQGIQRLHTQGALLQTGVTSDLAVGGNGFFVVEGQANGGEGRFFTRNGQFRLDDQGRMVNAAGLRLLGYQADASGNVGSTLGDLAVGFQTSAPQPTTLAQLGMNLDPNAEVLPAGIPVDAADWQANAAASATIEVYDSLGNAHAVTVYFGKTSEGEWTWEAFVDDGDLGGTAGDFTSLGTGTLSFDGTGQLTTDPATSTLTVQFAGADSQDFDLDFAGSTQVKKDGVPAGQGSGVESLDIDGRAAGNLSFLTIEPDGTIFGAFSNGDSRVLGQVAIALIQAPDKMDSIGGNLFRLGPDSGDPAYGVANVGGRGQVFSGALEQSNVDLSNEFTQLIINQRGFQASSRTISTANTLLGELVNLGR